MTAKSCSVLTLFGRVGRRGASPPPLISSHRSHGTRVYQGLRSRADVSRDIDEGRREGLDRDGWCHTRAGSALYGHVKSSSKDFDVCC